MIAPFFNFVSKVMEPHFLTTGTSQIRKTVLWEAKSQYFFFALKHWCWWWVNNHAAAVLINSTLL
jgi:hypothetical protein